jgi:hypothetical protein
MHGLNLVPAKIVHAVDGDPEQAVAAMLATRPLYERIGILTDTLRAEEIRRMATKRVLVRLAFQVAQAEGRDPRAYLRELQAEIGAEEREMGLRYGD